MRKLVVCAGVLLAVCLLLPSPASGQKKGAKKKDKAPVEVATEQDYVQLRQMKEISGKLTTLDPTARTMTLVYEYQTYEAAPPKAGKNPNAQMQKILRQQQQLMREYQEILRSRSPLQQQQRMQQWQFRAQKLQAQMAQLGLGKQTLFQPVKHFKEFEFDLADEVRVARVKLEVEYDDKGNVKEHTPEELKKRRDKELPGYTAKFEEVLPGQTLKLYLGKPKAATTPKKDEKGAGEEKGLGVTGNRPLVRAILIQAEVDPALLPKEPKRKKKN
ncbi:MAG: hypothetical protein L0Z62_30725 [Gemmataceae bacterium]|nr:hypothetical protein [Gemmataceae bacterium]